MHREFSWLTLSLAIVGSALGAGTAVPTTESGTHVLQIHLPREVTVQDSVLRLDGISVVKGEAAVVATAGALGMGRLSVPGQRMVLDRPTIVSRLASCGISAEDVRLTGAERVVVRRDQEIISTEDFLEIGRAFLREHPPVTGIGEVVPSSRPKDLVLPGNLDDLRVTPRLVRNGARGYVTVQILVTAGDEQIGVREIPFRLRYQRRRAVTSKPVAEGAVLTPENVEIQVSVSDWPEPANWQPPYGLITRRPLPEDTEIVNDMMSATASSVLIRRNETVLIRIERPGLLVTAMGTALQEARAGEPLKVRNADSRRVIVCKVNQDGSVEPML